MSRLIPSSSWAHWGRRRLRGGNFAAEGLVLNFVSASRYLGAYLVPKTELEAWVKPQVESWAHGVRVLVKIVRRHPQSPYARLGMSLQLEYQYLQRDVPGVGTLMGPIEDALRDKFFPALFGGEEINADFWLILVHSVEHSGLGIPDPSCQKIVHTTPLRRLSGNW